ncbi:hypothetical protein QO009_001409 [Brevibacillus aydinogluensis]|nr:hypothetical protein [Brevibacillus aydinogluensis]
MWTDLLMSDNPHPPFRYSEFLFRFRFFCFSLYDNFQSVYNHEFSVNKNVRKLLAVDPTRLADFLTSVSFKWSVSYGEVASFSLVLLK